MALICAAECLEMKMQDLPAFIHAGIFISIQQSEIGYNPSVMHVMRFITKITERPKAKKRGVPPAESPLARMAK
jgi:hypothetical protein